MHTALILGISGGFGSHVAQALARKGYLIRALMRDPRKLPQRLKGAEIILGDAGNIDEVRRAAKGVDIIVYGVNPPKYQWKGVVLPLLENTARVAEEMRLTIVFPGNVYVFDPSEGPAFDEIAPKHPVSSKGQMRKAMEARLKSASENGARVIIIRMGDFIGENVASSWFTNLISKNKKSYTLKAAGNLNLKHSWAYLPDVGRTVAELAERRNAFQAFNVFHFKGYQLSLNDIARNLEQVSGKPVTIARFPWLEIKLLSPFSSFFKGLLEVRYLWNQPLNLQQHKLESALTMPVPHTSFTQALLESGFNE